MFSKYCYCFVLLISKERNFWKDDKNQREFLDSIAKEFDILCPEDWNKITIKDVYNKGIRVIVLLVS